MVDSGLTSRAVARTVTTSSPVTSTRKRTQQTSFFKIMQTILGPKVATLKNLLWFIIVVQAFAILLLILTVIAKNNAIAGIESMGYEAWSTGVPGYQKNADNAYGRPPPENDQQLREAMEDANYDDMDPAITGITEAKKFTTLFGKFTRCKPKPCYIDHWAYIGDKCFYRDDNVKDRDGHNSSIWSLVQDDMYYTVDNDFACPVEICRHTWKQEINMTRQIVLRALQEHYNQTNSTVWNVEDMYTGNKYMRVNPYWGLEYKIHGGFTLTSVDQYGNERAENKSGTVTVRRGFTLKFCDVSVNTEVPPRTEPIYIIVPYTGRVEQLRLFYQNLKELIDQGVELRAIISTFGGPVHILGASELLRDMELGISEGELSDGHIVQVVEAGGDLSKKFSRSKALLDGAEYAPADAIIFYCDVDMTIMPGFFENCRHNAQRNYQVYYPVVYSLYPYGYKVSREHGYWRKGAFGMVCGYKSDFKRMNMWKFAQGRLKGWGFEDTMLYKEFSKHWQISVFHAIEPNLLHRWHPKFCEFNLHVAACLGTIFQNMGSQAFLASLVANAGIDVRNIEYDPAPVIFSTYKNDSHGSNGGIHDVPLAETDTDLAKHMEMKRQYDILINEGKAGLLSLFAKEAQEILSQATAAQAAHPEEKITLPPVALGVEGAMNAAKEKAETHKAKTISGDGTESNESTDGDSNEETVDAKEKSEQDSANISSTSDESGDVHPKPVPEDPDADNASSNVVAPDAPVEPKAPQENLVR